MTRATASKTEPVGVARHVSRNKGGGRLTAVRMLADGGPTATLHCNLVEDPSWVKLAPDAARLLRRARARCAGRGQEPTAGSGSRVGHEISSC